MLGGNAGFAQTYRDDRRVPHRRKTRFDAHTVSGLMLQPFQFALLALENRMVALVTERLQRDNGIEHRWKNRRETVATRKAFEHPLLTALQRRLPKRMNAVFRKPFRQFVQPIQPEEKIAERDLFRVGRQCEVALVDAVRIKFVQRDVDRARRLEMVDDRQRHDHAARPVAHVPEIHMEPFADEQHFARNRRHIFPREQTDECEIQFGKSIHARHAAEMPRHLPRLQHPGIRHRHARQFQREIRLDRRIHFRRPAVVNIPAPVRQLHREDVIDRFALPFLIHAAIPVMIRHHVRDQR